MPIRPAEKQTYLLPTLACTLFFAIIFKLNFCDFYINSEFFNLCTFLLAYLLLKITTLFNEDKSEEKAN